MDPTAPDGRTPVDLAAVEARPIVAVRERVRDVAGGDELRDALARRWGPGGEIPLEIEAATIWHDCGRSTGQVDCEAALVPAPGGQGPTPCLRGLRSGVLDSAIVARVRPVGPSASTSEVYLAGWRRLASLELSLAGPVREWVRYVQGEPEVTELQFPIARL